MAEGNTIPEDAAGALPPTVRLEDPDAVTSEGATRLRSDEPQATVRMDASEVAAVAVRTARVTAAPRRAPVAQPAVPREMPVRLGRYLIEGVIGRGGMGIVYRARQEGLDRVVALKLLLEGENALDASRRRFAREARAMAKLRHPNIVAVHEVGEYEGQPFFTMDFVDGMSLTRFMQKVNVESHAIIADICARIADGVHYAHQQRVIHRDLKPDNILMTASGEPVITDFGLAKDVDHDSMLSLSGQVMGTPAFMAPEQATGHIHDTDRRTDVYALGAILYWMLTDHEPFKGQTVLETLSQVATAEPREIRELNPAVESDLSAICLKAMEKEKERRYATAREFSEDLRRFINGEPVFAKPVTGWGRVIRTVRRHRTRVIAVAAGMAAALVLALGATALWSRSYVDVVRRQMESPVAAKRAEAATGLARELLAPEQIAADEVQAAAGLLLPLLTDPDDDVRLAVLKALSEPGMGDVMKPVLTAERVGGIAALDRGDRTPVLRRAALAAMGNLPHPVCTEHLVGRLGEPDPLLRMAVVRALGQQGTVSVITPLVRVVVNDPVCRGEAERALARIYREGTMARLGKAQVAMQGLDQVTAAVADSSRQLDALLGEMDGRDPAAAASPLAAQEKALAARDAGVRLRAVYELGLSGETAVVPLLVRVLQDEDEDVGVTAAMSLIGLGSQGNDALRNALVSGMPRVRARAARGLAQAGTAGDQDRIRVALAAEKDVHVRAAMERALAGVESP